MTEFSAERLAALADERGLEFNSHVLGEVVAALDAGKHVLLTGAPGTGKTSLAYITAELAQDALMSSEYVAVTASSEWGVSDTVGRHVTGPSGLIFQPGIVLQALQSSSWLVIDELNRADFDKAFGPLFTVLAGQAVTLPYRQQSSSNPISIVPSGMVAPRNTDAIRVPRQWRIIATMNEFDKETLYRMSYALMRRFAFIEVEAPDDDVFRKLVQGDGECVADLLPVRRFVDLGPAIFVDAANYAARRADDVGVPRSRVLFEAFYSFFLPQLDQLDDRQAAELFDAVAPLFEAPELNELRRAVRKVLGGSPQLRKPVTSKGKATKATAPTKKVSPKRKISSNGARAASR